MSSYVTFWVKNAKGQYTVLTSYSRSSELYAALHTNGCSGKRVKTNDEVFGERIIAQPFTRRDSANCVVTLEHNINTLKAAKDSFQENIQLALQTSDPLEEKMEYVNTCKAEIEECEEEISANKRYIYLLQFIEEIREENHTFGDELDYDDIIWAGIDASLEGETEEN